MGSFVFLFGQISWSSVDSLHSPLKAELLLSVHWGISLLGINLCGSLTSCIKTACKESRVRLSGASGICSQAISSDFCSYCPTGKCCFLGKFKLQKDCNQSCLSKRILGLVEMTCGLVHTRYSLHEWQAVN